MPIRRRLLQVRQNLRDDRRLFDAGNHLELPAAARTGLDVDPEQSGSQVAISRSQSIAKPSERNWRFMYAMFSRVHCAGGTPLAIAVAAGQPDDTPALRAAAARARRLREAEQLLAADPVVQALLRDFPGARIVPGSVEPLDPSH